MDDQDNTPTPIRPPAEGGGAAEVADKITTAVPPPAPTRREATQSLVTISVSPEMAQALHTALKAVASQQPTSQHMMLVAATMSRVEAAVQEYNDALSVGGES